MTPTRKQTELSTTTRPEPVPWHRTMTALAAATILTAASCEGTPAPAPPPVVTYPKLPAAPIAYTLPDPGPSRYQVAYQTGRRAYVALAGEA